MIEISALWPWALIFCVEFLWMKISVQRLQVSQQRPESSWKSRPKAPFFKGKISGFLVLPFGCRTPSQKWHFAPNLAKHLCNHKMVHRSIYNIYTVTLVHKMQAERQVCTIQECVCVCVVHTRPTFVPASFPRCWSPTNSFQAPLLAP